MNAYKKGSFGNSALLSPQGAREVGLGVKSAVHAFDPNAQVVMFGSRARGDAREDSDYDFLILLHQPVDLKLKRMVLDRLYEVELQTGCVIGALIENIKDWQMMEHSPIFSEIELEGVAV